MKKNGFTLIELVVVIVILGILAATALPRFVDLSGDAGDASAKGVGGALSSAAATNFAKAKASGAAPGVAVTAATTCTGLAALLAGAAFPANVTMVTGADTLAGCGASGNTDATCFIKHAQGATAAGFAVRVVCTG